MNPVGGTTQQSDNALQGFYADGYFDRRIITSAKNATTGYAVEAESPNVGYMGRLFVNPNNNASLFFPTAGYRMTASLTGLGRLGTYWTSSVQTASSAWYFYSGSTSTNVSQLASNYEYGYSIRCVVDE